MLRLFKSQKQSFCEKKV
uniref:Uncharacterized protein n=1 Tax=Rhizophora mucronata TaxID=61149 RepID=A0A2P2PAB4_RHIMU